MPTIIISEEDIEEIKKYQETIGQLFKLAPVEIPKTSIRLQKIFSIITGYNPYDPT